MELKEKLFIWRKRLNKNQAALAKELGLSVGEYYAAEHGLNALLLQDVPDPGVLSDRERCVLARRRSGLTQREVAAALGAGRTACDSAFRGHESHPNSA